MMAQRQNSGRTLLAEREHGKPNIAFRADVAAEDTRTRHQSRRSPPARRAPGSDGVSSADARLAHVPELYVGGRNGGDRAPICCYPDCDGGLRFLVWRQNRKVLVHRDSLNGPNHRRRHSDRNGRGYWLLRAGRLGRQCQKSLLRRRSRRNDRSHER